MLILEAILKKYIKEFLNEVENDRLNIEKYKWYDLKDDISDQEIEELIKSDIVDIIGKSYANIGGHPWINNPKDLDWYDDIKFIDNDEDGQIDAAIVGKEGPFGVKFGAGASDGSSVGKSAYINKSAELRGQGEYWGEVSGAVAHQMLKKGLRPVEEKSQVEKLIGTNITWFGDCPVDHPSFHGRVPSTFVNAKGWYERDIGGTKHMKIIIGKPDNI